MGGEYPNYKNWVCGECDFQNLTEYEAKEFIAIIKKVRCEKCETEYCLVLPSNKFLNNKK